ncbi:MAG: hypothetical protein OXI83_13410 [Gemmatimonadota bacterium]|nr:hypothetical protein [Gemmatimonadota bacterium]
MEEDDMTNGRMEGDIRDAHIKWKVPTAGMVWQAGFVVLAVRDPHPFPCTAYDYDFDDPPEEIEAHLSTCRETWAEVWGLEGDTLEEARQALAESRFRGIAYHVNDCELLDDRPSEDALQQEKD